MVKCVGVWPRGSLLTGLQYCVVTEEGQNHNGQFGSRPTVKHNSQSPSISIRKLRIISASIAQFWSALSALMIMASLVRPVLFWMAREASIPLLISVSTSFNSTCSLTSPLFFLFVLLFFFHPSYMPRTFHGCLLYIVRILSLLWPETCYHHDIHGLWLFTATDSTEFESPQEAWGWFKLPR